MYENDNLCHCRFSCGRVLHTECMERWVKHKQQNSQAITCPMCRSDWGTNVLEDLQETTKAYRIRRKHERLEEQKGHEKAKRDGLSFALNSQA